MGLWEANENWNSWSKAQVKILKLPITPLDEDPPIVL
jgi:hypothetical protein